MGKMTNRRWYFHPEHGHMLRRQFTQEDGGWDFVVTHLLLGAAEFEVSKEKWDAVTHRLYVNAGCGYITVGELRSYDHNKDFKRTAAAKVPEWVRKDFLAALEGP